MLRKVLVWGGIAFLIFFVFFRPDVAGDAVRTFGDGFMYFVDLFAGIFI